jgi:hypothetical protein
LLPKGKGLYCDYIHDLYGVIGYYLFGLRAKLPHAKRLCAGIADENYRPARARF